MIYYFNLIFYFKIVLKFILIKSIDTTKLLKFINQNFKI